MSFYDNGLKFECQGCSYCCAGEPGYVFLTEANVNEISAYLNVSKEDFIKFYTRPVVRDGKLTLSLKEKENYRCVFLSGKGCKIYPVRPLQCSTYPFWPSVMKDEKSWIEESSYCPGFGKGEVHSKEEIDRKLKAMKDQKFIEIV